MVHSKSPTYKPSSCKLSKMWTCVPAPVCKLLYCTTALFKVLYCKTKHVVFTFCVCFLCTYYLCEKYYKPTTVQYYIADCVSWVPRLTLLDLNKLDLRTCSWNGTRLSVGDILYTVGEYYKAIQMNRYPLHAITIKDLVNIMLNKRNET